MPFFMPGNGNLKFRKVAKEPPSTIEDGLDDTPPFEEAAEPLTRASNADLSDHEPLELEEAAQKLGCSQDELKRRFRTGEVRGFAQDSHLYIYVPETGIDEQGGVDGAARDSGDSPATVIEYQKVEINRLIKANNELRTEKERLYRLLEREQVLRQGMQRAMEQAWQRLALPRGNGELEERDDHPADIS